MKTKMTKLISVKSIPLLVLALLIVLGPALATSRYPVSGSGVVDLKTYSGDVSLTIGRKEWSGVVKIDPGKIVERGGGVLHYYDVVHIFADPYGNTFTTIGNEVMTPTGEEKVYTLNGYMEITGGTEGFERAGGRLSVRGELNLSTELASFEVNGAMSF